MTDPARHGYIVVELAAEQTHALRLAVLRNDTPTTSVVFDGDDLTGTVHLGVSASDVGGDGIVAISTWVPKSIGGEPAVQLRGMATAQSVRGTGVGVMLLAEGCRRASAVAPLVWARARDTALGFYTRNGFDVVGEGFVDPSTGKPHHVIVRRST
ncbi:MAG: GNAT family N-acetyltransferase [Ilumatobacteraceae bacterium]